MTQRHSGKTGVVCRHSLCAPVQCSPPGQSPAVVWGLVSLPGCAASPSALRLDLGPVGSSLSKTQGFSHFSQVRGAHSVGDKKIKAPTPAGSLYCLRKASLLLERKKKKQTSQNPSVDGGRAHEDPLLAEKLLAVCGCRDEGQFSSGTQAPREATHVP